MSNPRILIRLSSQQWIAGLALILAIIPSLVDLAAASSTGVKTTPPSDRREIVAQLDSPTGSLLMRDMAGKGWKAVKQNAPLYSGDLLVQSSVNAFIDSKTGAVRLALLEDLSDLSNHQGFESAVLLHYNDNPDFDLDFTLERGLVGIINQKKQGAAKVKVRFHRQVWVLTLEEPGTRVGMELWSRWARGTPFVKDPQEPFDEPAAHLGLLVLQGQLYIKHGNEQHSMNSPPGPALIRWDSVDQDHNPERLETLPARALPEATKTESARKLRASFEKLRNRFEEQPVEAAIAAILTSTDAMDRRVAVINMGAVDDLKGLADALHDAKHPDVRDTAVLVLRQWIGRNGEQDLKLYKTMLTHKVNPVHAEVIMQLLHSFGDGDLCRPETYETLITYLDHPKLAIRELAQWHLYRLVPAGNHIKYDAAGSEAERKKAQDEWKKLVPDGKAPKATHKGEK